MAKVVIPQCDNPLNCWSFARSHDDAFYGRSGGGVGFDERSGGGVGDESGGLGDGFRALATVTVLRSGVMAA